jgi:hypothetical protein
MKRRICNTVWFVLAFICSAVWPLPTAWAGVLSGTNTSIHSGADINLTAAGPLDWVHWGLYTATSLDRKSGVTPQIGDWTVIGPSNAFTAAYQFGDNGNGYSWSDGTPTASVTNTTTGVWAYGVPNIGTGFELSVPADTTMRTLKVYVGAFAAKGRFEASLSDMSAADYLDSSLSNMRNGPSAVYALQYAANSAGQTLRIRYTLELPMGGLVGNVTLQAAALTANGANNPPIVSISSPTNNATYTTPANLTITADAMDLDGTVTKVEFYDGANKLGQDTNSPYSFTWNSAPAGYHVLTAVATDNSADFSTSMPVEIFVNNSGGSLSGGNAVPPATLDLTVEGTADWAHWGLVSSNSFDHKSGVAQKISDITVLGTQAVQQYADNFTAYTWTDGTPTPSATNSTTGVFITGITNGFEIQAPADTTPRRLKVYVGLYGAQGNFQAFLGDFSAPAYTDTSLNNVFGNSYAVYTLDYAAATAGQNLIVQYRSLTLYDQDFGNVTLQAATLVGNSSGNVPPTVSITGPTNNAHFTAPTNISITASAADSDGSVSKVEFFQGTAKLGESTNSPYSLVWSNVGAGSYTLTARATDNLGAATVSAPVSISVSGGTPPVIVVQPVSAVVTQGKTNTFSVTAIGAAPLSYQWRFGIPGSGGANLAGATNAILSVTNAQPTNAGNYRVIITNLFGSATSAVATLTVLVPPSITQQPQSQTVPEGTNVAFTVMATGTLPLSYQWYFNGNVLSGQTNTMLTIANVQATNGGNYTVLVSNQAGSATSTLAGLRVLAQPVITRIVQIGTTAGISFTTVSGLTYTVQYKNGLDDATWAAILPSVSGAGSEMTVNDTAATVAGRFYRVRVE